jgi:hypothetical protein
MRYILALVLAAAPLPAVERAAYDSLGRLTALLSEREDLKVGSSIVAVLPSGKRVPIQIRTRQMPLTRKGMDLSWSGSFMLPDEGRGRFQLKSEESTEGLRYSVTVSADTTLEVTAIEWTLDLPRQDFQGGQMTSDG